MATVKSAPEPNFMTLDELRELSYVVEILNDNAKPGKVLSLGDIPVWDSNGELLCKIVWNADCGGYAVVLSS